MNCKYFTSNENARVVIKKNVYLTAVEHFSHEPPAKCQERRVDIFDLWKVIQGQTVVETFAQFGVNCGIFPLGVCEPYWNHLNQSLTEQLSHDPRINNAYINSTHLMFGKLLKDRFDLIENFVQLRIHIHFRQAWTGKFNVKWKCESRDKKKHSLPNRREALEPRTVYNMPWTARRDLWSSAN